MIGQLGYLHFNCAMSCHLLRVGKHIDTHMGESSACPDNHNNDDEQMMMRMMRVVRPARLVAMIMIILKITLKGQSSADDDHDDDDDRSNDDHVEDYIGRAILWTNRATTVTACVLFNLQCNVS